MIHVRLRVALWRACFWGYMLKAVLPLLLISPLAAMKAYQFVLLQAMASVQIVSKLISERDAVAA